MESDSWKLLSPVYCQEEISNYELQSCNLDFSNAWHMFVASFPVFLAAFAFC